jgi:hypothetical protein
MATNPARESGLRHIDSYGGIALPGILASAFADVQEFSAQAVSALGHWFERMNRALLRIREFPDLFPDSPDWRTKAEALVRDVCQTVVGNSCDFFTYYCPRGIESLADLHGWAVLHQKVVELLPHAGPVHEWWRQRRQDAGRRPLSPEQLFDEAHAWLSDIDPRYWLRRYVRYSKLKSFCYAKLSEEQKEPHQRPEAVLDYCRELVSQAWKYLRALHQELGRPYPSAPDKLPDQHACLAAFDKVVNWSLEQEDQGSRRFAPTLGPDADAGRKGPGVPPAQHSPEQAGATAARVDPQKLAILLLVEDRHLSLPEIAEKVGVDRKTVYKWPQFLELAEKYGKYKPRGRLPWAGPRGSKQDGRLEAYDESDED